jgi:phosphatidylglycerophosphate synthase
MRLFTWANLLTLIRLAVAVPCAYAVSVGDWRLAVAWFAVAVVTDVADGMVARGRGEVSHLGGLLDHSSDAIFVSLTLAALAARDAVPGPLPVLVLVSFAQYVLDSRALAGQPLRASPLGRWNGIVRYALDLPWPPAQWILAAGWLLVVSTVLSMADRGYALLRARRAA